MPKPMHLIHDLKIWQKFMLLAALAVALCTPQTVLLVLGQARTLQSVSDEQAGISPVGALLPLIQQTQTHRGVSAQWLGGNDSLQSSRQTRATELDRAMEAMQSATAIYRGGKLDLRRTTLLRSWRALQADVASRAVDGTTTFARQNALVAEPLRLLADVSDRSGLMLDPESRAWGDQRAVEQDLRHHRGDRRHRFPDQYPRTQRSGRGCSGWRAGSRLCGAGVRGAKPSPAQRERCTRNQDLDRRQRRRGARRCGGAALVGQAQQTLGEIVGQAQQVSVLIGEIGTAIAEQSDGITQVNQAVSQLDQATQQNAALVEESAAAADSLKQQARRLVEAVSRFRIQPA